MDACISPMLSESKFNHWSMMRHTTKTHSQHVMVRTATLHCLHPHGAVFCQQLEWVGKCLDPTDGDGNATHSNTLAWKIPWMKEPGRLQSIGSQRVRHDWAISLSLFTFICWRRKWQPTPVFLPGESQGQGSLVGCRLWGHTESDTTEATQHQQQQQQTLQKGMWLCRYFWLYQKSSYQKTSQAYWIAMELWNDN